MQLVNIVIITTVCFMTKLYISRGFYLVSTVLRKIYEINLPLLGIEPATSRMRCVLYALCGEPIGIPHWPSEMN